MSFFTFADSQNNVEVVYSKATTKNLELELTGSVTASNDAYLTSFESGIVSEILVEVGDYVKKGQVLAKLDDAILLVNLEHAHSQLIAQRADYLESERLVAEVEELAKKEVIAKTLLSERKARAMRAKALLDVAKANKKEMELRIERHILRAPFSGFITQRNIDIGEYIGTQSQVFQLVSNESLTVISEVPQEYFHDLTQQENITSLIISDSPTVKPLQLDVSRIVRVSNPVSRTFQVRVDLPKTSEFISGMSATVRLQIPNEHILLSNIPRSALKRHPDGNYSIFAVDNHRVKRISVELIESNLDQVTVSGLSKNTAVIISQEQQLVEGAPVFIKGAK
ncbi:MAG: efflux RND transporter periplasmic adaptor subunit [Parashewanella sp.]